VTLLDPARLAPRVIGPNGAGKSTLLKIMAGSSKAGRVEIPGTPPVAARGGSRSPQAELVDWAFPVTVVEVE